MSISNLKVYYTKKKDKIMQINDRLKKARKEAGLTQKQLAEKMGIMYQQLYKYEAGKQEMTASKLKAFCEICKADANWILGIGEYDNEN